MVVPRNYAGRIIWRGGEPYPVGERRFLDKKRERYCEICGRRLKTGRKYCYACKSLSKDSDFNPRTKAKPLTPKQIGIYMFSIGIVLIIVSLYFTFKIGNIVPLSLCIFGAFFAYFGYKLMTKGNSKVQRNSNWNKPFISNKTHKNMIKTIRDNSFNFE